MNAQPMCSPEAEKSVLGAAIISPSIAPQIVSELTVDDFYSVANRSVFEALKKLVAKGAPVDVVQLQDSMPPHLGIDGHTAMYLMDLANSVPTAENVDHYMTIVRTKTAARRLLAACADVPSQVASGQDVDEVVEGLSERLTSIVTRSAASLVSVGDEMSGLLSEIEKRAEKGTEKKAPGFGIGALDDMIAPVPGNLIVIAGRPGGGKTALVMQFVMRHCLNGGTSLTCNLEMTRRELAERQLVTASRLNSSLVRRGELDFESWRSGILPAAAKLRQIQCFIEDASFRMREIASISHRWRARFGNSAGVLVVDYLQLMRTDESRTGGRHQEVGGFARGLKELAKRLGVPVIAVSSLKRAYVPSGGDTVGEGRPTMSDLKESGDIEYAADAIVLLHNPNKTEDGAVEVIVEKNRNGKTGSLWAHWTGRHYSFGDAE